MTYLAPVLSFLFPGLLFVHAIARLFVAGAKKSRLLAGPPAMGFAFAAMWMAQSCSAQLAGGLSPEARAAQTTVGPLLFCALAAMVELPFGAYWLHSKRAAKRARK